MHWMFMPFRRYADFSGRSRRMEFWMYTLFHSIITTVFVILFIASFPWAEMIAQSQAEQTGMIYTGPPATPGAGIYIFGLLWILWALATLIPTIAVSVRRLHDQDKSGWLYLISFIPFGSIVLLIFYFLDGTRGPNQYGPDPKG
jgi:uncharacterized membrane protein YhaH (DUF805 family)